MDDVKFPRTINAHEEIRARFDELTQQVSRALGASEYYERKAKQQTEAAEELTKLRDSYKGLLEDSGI